MDGVHRWTTRQTIIAWARFTGFTVLAFIVYWWAIYSTMHVFLSQDRGYGYVEYFDDYKNVITPPFDKWMGRK